MTITVGVSIIFFYEGLLIKSIISIIFNDTAVNNFFSLYHTDTNKLVLVYFFQYTKKWSEISPLHTSMSHRLLGGGQYLLFTSEQADQRARKVLFTSVVYTNTNDNDRTVIIILIILSVMIIEIMINSYMRGTILKRKRFLSMKKLGL